MLVANLSMVVIDTAVVRFLLPVLPVGTALMAEARGWGIQNIIMLPTWIKIVVAVVALDHVIYLQHVLFHLLPILWRLHRMHHTDLEIDVTTVIPRGTNGNFGFNLPWWDRLCGTCRPQPEEGHDGMTIGLKEFRDAGRLTLFRFLIQPLVRWPVPTARLKRRQWIQNI